MEDGVGLSSSFSSPQTQRSNLSVCDRTSLASAESGGGNLPGEAKSISASNLHQPTAHSVETAQQTEQKQLLAIDREGDRTEALLSTAQHWCAKVSMLNGLLLPEKSGVIDMGNI